MISSINKLFDGRTLGATLNASSAIMKVLVEHLTTQDAQTIFCKDTDSRDLFFVLAKKIQTDLEGDVADIPARQRDEIVRALDLAVTSATQKVSHFNPSRARTNLAKLRRLKIDLV